MVQLERYSPVFPRVSAVVRQKVPDATEGDGTEVRRPVRSTVSLLLDLCRHHHTEHHRHQVRRAEHAVPAKTHLRPDCRRFHHYRVSRLCRRSTPEDRLRITNHYLARHFDYVGRLFDSRSDLGTHFLQEHVTFAFQFVQ
jgi:hypothetical protein